MVIENGQSLSQAVELAIETGFWKYQKRVHFVYVSRNVQIGVSFLIVFNFLVTCIQKQIDPRNIFHTVTWSAFEDFFNIVFFLELLVNMYGSWMWPFFRSTWNRFDLLVVSIGLLDLFKAPMPGPLRMARLLRAFRVCRLFGRIESLKIIIVMIRRALPGVASAFTLNFIILAIYSVLAVDFFRDLYDDCHDPARWGNVSSISVSARGQCFGREYYGRFLPALYSMFQVLTGESWSEMAVRPVLFYYENSFFECLGVSIFFISFIIINSVVLINVVVAVLIDGMSKPSDGPAKSTTSGEVANRTLVRAGSINSMTTEKAEDDGEAKDALSVANDVLHALAMGTDGVGGMAPVMEELTVDDDNPDRRKWLQRWMHPETVIPKHHKKNILAAKRDVSAKLEALKTEAASLREELDVTAAEMRLQLQEVLTAVRDTLQEETYLEENGDMDLYADEGVLRGIHMCVDTNPEDTVTCICMDPGESNGMIRVHNLNDRVLTHPSGPGGADDGHESHRDNHKDPQFERPAVLQDNSNGG